MADELSAKQRGILQFLEDFIAEHDYPPSIRDIQNGCDISSTSVVDYNLKRLEEKGFIRRDREVSRAIELLDGQGERRRRGGTVQVPVLGKIAAGLPLPVHPDQLAPEDVLDLTADIAGNRAGLYALRVQGTSMIDALINDGDIVILEPKRSADPGDVVAAWIVDREETTLKKYYPEGAKVRLQPMNSTMEPIIEDAANVEVQGKLVATIRAF
ncbi:MAG: transcriptional repressor LexA [Dehalococcoidia bacterium]|nr:transcriptional repressor LexA [Dehalococcoidia bacterium]MCA9850453.1 transcriptional repressor LexA [Dehalococcoidia bacterium]MCA9856549.1 transcriptional repressor LexA [Dehalococcoidia bacterium]MCB9492465.1 transcriptional repressor LexA [Dehalococcoidia bacterium]